MFLNSVVCTNFMRKVYSTCVLGDLLIALCFSIILCVVKIEQYAMLCVVMVNKFSPCCF